MNKALKILLATDSLVILATAMLGPIYAIFVKEIGGDILTASTTWAIFTLVTGVVIYLLGHLEDRIRETELAIVAGYLIMALGHLGYLWVAGPSQLFIIQVVLGVGTAIQSPAFNAVYSRHLDKGRFASQWGNWDAANYTITALGALVGGVVVTLFGFKILFVIMFGLCLASGLYILFLPRRIL